MRISRIITRDLLPSAHSWELEKGNKHRVEDHNTLPPVVLTAKGWKNPSKFKGTTLHKVDNHTGHPSFQPNSLKGSETTLPPAVILTTRTCEGTCTVSGHDFSFAAKSLETTPL
jgi:hypothetical protein